MTEAGDPDETQEKAERIAAHHDVLKDGWKRTLQDMYAMADELAEEGWETYAIGAGDTAPEHPDASRKDRWGLVYVIPGNKVEDFEAAFREDGYPEYNVYRSVASGFVFSVTELRDPDTRTALFLAGQYEQHKARPLMEIAKSEGTMWTHVQKIDGTVLGSFKHDDYTKFFPQA